jgi:lipoyl synthase
MDVQRKPEWLKIKANTNDILEMEKLLKVLSLHTVCEGAACPNIGECFKNKTATFMILGENCTRNCRFCQVTKGIVQPLNPEEPENVAKASKQLGLKHIVVTSVTRDDLKDGGAEFFAQTIHHIREYLPHSSVEVLIPDFQGDITALYTVLDAKPDILNHNIETVPELYHEVRPMAAYERSLELLKRVKEYNPHIYTKSGLMVGFGETKQQIQSVMDDLREMDCDILTIGQYLQPSKAHLRVVEYITPEQFDEYRLIGLEKGFKYVASGPLVRSSYNAVEGMNVLSEG